MLAANMAIATRKPIMKICVTAQGNDLDSLLDPRFGRCQFFIFIDTEDLHNYEAIANTNIDATGGAGIQSAQFVVEKEIKAVLTGKVGPNAERVLKAANVDVFTDFSGTVSEVINNFKNKL